MGGSLAAGSPLACVEFQMAGSVVLCVSVCPWAGACAAEVPSATTRSLCLPRETQGCWVELLFAFSFVLIVAQLSLRPLAALLS